MFVQRVLCSSDDFAQRATLLASRHLTVPTGHSLGVFDDETLLAVGSLEGDTIQGVAVALGHDGEGLMTGVVTALLTEGLTSQDNIRVFTKAATARSFEDLGFSLVASTPEVALLEWRKKWETSLEELRQISVQAGVSQPAGIVVMNANPFTLGHRWLVEHAVAQHRQVFVLVVEEDRSLFPFQVRLELVRAGTADLPEVRVLPGGKYVIASATFPSYFTRETALVRVHAELDARLFATGIAPALGANVRYVGAEPLCAATAAYNDVLHRMLPPLGIDVVEIPRKEMSQEVVSASRVRACLREKQGFDRALALVPPSTQDWLRSPLAHTVLERLRLTG